MLFSLVVIASSALVGGFLLVWWLVPSLRPWFEAPKYRVLRWDERFGDAPPRS
jgi:hypothetical protein